MPVGTGAIAPFGGGGGSVWLRCALHAHTSNSDGMLAPAMLRRYYALGGYDVLAITDHDQLTPPEDGPDRLLALPGAELTLRAPVSGGPLHVVALGVAELPTYRRDTPLDEVAAATGALGGVAIVAHPAWSGLLPDELGDLTGVTAIEVHNAGCEVEQGRGDSAYYWDCLLARGVRVNALATDDHHVPGFDTFRAWTMIRAADRTSAAILDALRSGSFYSSCGPEIRALRIEDGALVVECTPAASIAAVSQPPHGGRVAAGGHGLSELGERLRGVGGLPEGALDGDALTGARFPLAPGARYLRVEVTDHAGRRAWSNPLWLDGDTEL